MKLKKKHYKITILKIFLIQLLTSIDFILPIRVLYMINFGINNGDIGVLRTIYSILVTILEIPTGVIADKISRRLSIVLSTICFALHAIVYVLYPNFTGFIFTQVFLSLSTSLASGTISSYTHDIIEDNSEQTYIKVVGDLSFIRSVISIALVASSSLIFYSNKHYNFIILAIGGLIGTIISITLPEERRNKRRKEYKIKENMKDYLNHIISNLKYLLTHKLLLSIILIHSINISILIFNFDYYQIILNDLKFNMKYIGMLYATFTLLSGIGAKMTNFLERNINYKKIIYLYVGMISISYLIIGITDQLLYLYIAIIFQQLCFGSWNLLVEASVLNNVADADSKSILESLHSSFFSLIKAIIILSLSGLMYSFNYKVTYNVLGIIGVVSIMVSMSYYRLKKRRIDSKNEYIRSEFKRN